MAVIDDPHNHKEININIAEKDVKKTLLSIDGGGIKGLIPVQVLFLTENLIKRYILHEFRKTKGILISKEKLEDILLFRQERLNNYTETIAKIDENDFDIRLSDFFESTAGTSTGAIIAVYIATCGVHGAQKRLLELIIDKKLQDEVKDEKIQLMKVKN